MQHTLTGCSIAEESETYIVSPLILFCKGQPGTRTNLRTYDPVSSKEFYIHPEEVHASTLPLGSPCGLTIQLCHTGISADAFGQGQAVVPIGRDKGIIRLGSRHTSRSNSFLSYIGMEKP